jgi:hypothetical protein
VFAVRQIISFQEAVNKNKKMLNQLLPQLASSRKPRSKPRSIEESEGLMMATIEAVEKAYSSGRLTKITPKGFILNRSKSHQL